MRASGWLGGAAILVWLLVAVYAHVATFRYDVPVIAQAVLSGSLRDVPLVAGGHYAMLPVRRAHGRCYESMVLIWRGGQRVDAAAYQRHATASWRQREGFLGPCAGAVR